MFENVKPPEDIFANVEPIAPPSALVPKDLPETPAMPVSDSMPSAPRSVSWKPIVIVATVLVVVGAAGGIAYFMLAAKGSSVPVEPDTSTVAAPPVVTAPAAVTPPVVTKPAPVVPNDAAVVPDVVTDGPKPMSDIVDRDKDGLTDSEEAKLGTSPTSADTDADGLFDKEEVYTYHTNPLNPDTDGDMYLDGAEVKKGYNPNGPGKLFGTTTTP